MSKDFFAGKCSRCGGDEHYTALYTTECSECGKCYEVDFGFNDKKYYGGKY